ncbi:hypothetical protein J6O48_01640 [bacterium]|nr:hypothetical protein [bacterium]
MSSALTNFINKLAEMSNIPAEDITVKKYDLDNLSPDDKETIVNTTNKVIKTFADLLGIDSSAMLYTTDELGSIIDKYNSKDVEDKPNEENVESKEKLLSKKDCSNCDKKEYCLNSNNDNTLSINTDYVNNYNNNLKTKLLNKYNEVNKPNYKDEYYKIILNKLNGDLDKDYSFDNSRKNPTVKVVIKDYLNLLNTNDYFNVLNEIKTKLIDTYMFSDIYISIDKEQKLIYFYICLM